MNPQTCMSAVNLNGFIVPGLILAALIVIFVVAWRFFRRMLVGDNFDDGSPSWGLEQLRQLRERGQINQEEYDRLRRAAMAAVAGPVSIPKTRGSDFRETDSAVDLLAGGEWTTVNADDSPSHHPQAHSGDGGLAGHHGGEPSFGSDGDFGGGDGGADFGGGDGGGGDCGGGGGDGGGGGSSD